MNATLDRLCVHVILRQLIVFPYALMWKAHTNAAALPVTPWIVMESPAWVGCWHNPLVAAFQLLVPGYVLP